MIEKIAETLYNHWRSSDRELATDWTDAPDNLRGVFTRQAEAVVDALDG